MTMQPNGAAPTAVRDGRLRLGAKGGAVAAAWQAMYDRLSRDTWADGRELARAVARAYDLQEVTLVTHLSQMAKEGFLESEVREVVVPTQRFGKIFEGKRRRTFYRIAS